MAETPSTHPLDAPDAAARRRAIAVHPSAPHPSVHPVDVRRSTATATTHAPTGAAHTNPADAPRSPAVLTLVGAPADADETGSMATEYGLITVVGATIASLCINWASGGGIYDLLGKVMQRIAGLLF